MHGPSFVVFGPAALTRQYCEQIVLLERTPLFESDDATCCLLVVLWRMFFASSDQGVTTSPCVEAGFEFPHSDSISAGKLSTAIAFDRASSPFSELDQVVFGVIFRRA